MSTMTQHVNPEHVVFFGDIPWSLLTWRSIRDINLLPDEAAASTLSKEAPKEGSEVMRWAGSG